MPTPPRRRSSKNNAEPAARGGWTVYRSRHRSANHHASHAEADGQALPEVLDHSLVPQEAPEIIRTQDELTDCLAWLREAGTFGYDTEFIGEQTFYPWICLIQVGTGDRIALIDPIVPGSDGHGRDNPDLDLTPFWELVADPNVRKIVHAGKQDLEPATRMVGRPPQNIFDTQIAAAFLGMDYPTSLVKLVKALADADLGAGAKFSQWDARPLTPVQMQYAANDVRYLPLICDEIEKQLEANGNAAACAEEMASLSEADAYRFDPRAQKIKAKGVAALSNSRRAVLEALVDWRFTEAERLNMPVRVFLPDQGLYNLAHAKPCSAQAVHACKAIPRQVKQRYMDDIIQITREVVSQPSRDYRQPRIPDFEAHKNEVDRLWAGIAAACEARAITPALATSKKELSRLVTAKMLGRHIPETRLAEGWRRDVTDDVMSSMFATSE